MVIAKKEDEPLKIKKIVFKKKSKKGSRFKNTTLKALNSHSDFEIS